MGRYNGETTELLLLLLYSQLSRSALPVFDCCSSRKMWAQQRGELRGSENMICKERLTQLQ